jgi:hypothetical protein
MVYYDGRQVATECEVLHWLNVQSVEERCEKERP